MIFSILIPLILAQTLTPNPAPPKPAPAPKDDSVMPSRPAVGFRGQPVALTKETQVVDAPGPTVSMAFGNVVAFSGDRLLISGAVISRRIASLLLTQII